MTIELVLWILSSATTVLVGVLAWLCLTIIRLNVTIGTIEVRNDERHAANLREFDKLWGELKELKN